MSNASDATSTASSEVAKAVYLADYRPPAYTTEQTDLHFDIRDGVTKVTSNLHVRRLDHDCDVLELLGEELTLLSVSVDGRALDDNEYEVSAQGLKLFGLEEHHQVQIVTEICPEKNTALEGLYPVQQHVLYSM